jgi:hypothetical protein
MIGQALKWTCAVGIAAGLTTMAARAQPDESVVTQVISLRHMDSMTAVTAVSELSIDDLYTVTSAARVNKMIVQGSPSAIKAVELVIAELDQPLSPPTEAELMLTEFVSVGTYPLGDLERIAHTALPLDERTRIAVDEVNSRLVVGGSAKDVAAVRSLVANLDRPRSTYVVEFFFIRSGGDGGGVPLPKAMAPIASSLEQSGFGSLSLLAPMIVRVDDGATFEQQARHALRHEDGPEQLDLRVRSAREGESLRMELKGQMSGLPRRDGSSNASFEIDTELSIPEGRYVVLAAAPASTRDMDAVALVVRVTSGSLD